MMGEAPELLAFCNDAKFHLGFNFGFKTKHWHFDTVCVRVQVCARAGGCVCAQPVKQGFLNTRVPLGSEIILLNMTEAAM